MSSLQSTLKDGLLEKPFDGSDAVPGGELRAKSRPADDIFDVDLCSLDGVIVRQDTKYLESLAQSVGIPYEAKQMYRVSQLDLPEGRRVALSPHDPQKHSVDNTQLYQDSRQPLVVAREESNKFLRCCLAWCGGLHLRALVMHMHEDAGQKGAYTEERALIRRPCRCGAKCWSWCFAMLFGLLAGLLCGAVYAVLWLRKQRTCDAGSASISNSTSGGDGFLCDAEWLEIYFIGAVITAGWLAGMLLCLPVGCCVGYRYRKRTRFEMVAELPRGPAPSDALAGGEVFGRVVEKTEPYPSMVYQCCCKCIHYDEIHEEGPGVGAGSRHVLTTRTSHCCCGRVNNCCGATCCKHDFIIDILDPETEEVVATLQRTYAKGDGCDALCRMCQQFQTYLVKFPPQATHRQRVLVLAAVLHLDYQHFEKQGGGEGGG